LKTFRRVLIANRGEIAVRIAQTLQEMGITAVAVHSEPDRRAVHVQRADEAYALDGKTSAETYLRGDKIIDLARAHGIDAIHPGYGFLSENEDFAQACIDAGITFIGPRPDRIRSMGDKIIARKTMAEAGVPVVPGWSTDSAIDPATLKREAGRIGYPVLVKAAAGGGGKGMRVVQSEAELMPAVEAAQREAGSAFGDARVFLEKYIADARHVEIQIFGDEHGNCVHLFERECSIQRRHQKIIEESPCVALSPQTREKMGEAGVKAARAVGYTNAGTVEFMLTDRGDFYFLEVNTRLQVDLVRAQILVAAGHPLPFSQSDLTQTGHALECRIYAEDAARNFMPSIGVIEHCVPPSGANIRVDSGVAAGSEVSVYYDPMLAKLIVWGRSRDEAIDRMAWALRRYAIVGVTTNTEFLRNVILHPEFRAGRTTTRFLEMHPITAAQAAGDIPDAALVAAALAARSNGRSSGSARLPADAHASPWQTACAWRVG
jgi:acetyl/propionyl-CoA carboxylase alpha subunit